MINKLMFVCSLVVSFSTQALSLGQIQWSDKNMAQCVNQTARDNTWSDTSQVTALKCHSADIYNADELVYLTSLVSLSLYNNKLEHLDLSLLKQLESVNLANNQLREVNLVGLKRLHTVYLFRNKLTTLDLSGLSSVTTLRVMQNKLVKVDIRPLVSLEKGYLFDNQLEDLPITGLNKLKFLDVKQNPMPDELYDFYDKQEGIIISHDGNADDWK